MSGPNNFKINRMKTEPLRVPRTMRRHMARGITSLPAGKTVPLAAFPLLREDAVRSGRMRFSFEMMETAEILMNPINVRVMAYLVPFLAFDRFRGSMDILNLSYEGKPPAEGEQVIPFIETEEFDDIDGEFWEYMGMHARDDQEVNTAYLEAYNQIWNFRAKNRSPDLVSSLRNRLETDLATAFWAHDTWRHVVPSVDLAAIDGEVPLNVVGAKLPIRGLGTGRGGSETYYQDIEGISTLGESGIARTSPVYVRRPYISNEDGGPLVNEIYAEMVENGITVSLSNLELARKTQAFARIRQQYNMHDDHIIALLMDGIQIPDQALKQPMLLADRTTIFGMSKRYASDSGNLTESVVNGATYIDLSVQVPRITTGGIVMIVAEITPDQLFERQEDPFLMAGSVDDLPQYLRDTLDPEKVDVVKNSRIDVDHDTPDATFGYEPLNARWNITAPRIGGKFYRPEVDAGFDEDRQRIWAVETKNPTLSKDFYLCTAMHTKPFVVTNQDPFECVTQGELFIEGNTVFGGHLIEATDDYEKIMAEAPMDRIEQEE